MHHNDYKSIVWMDWNWNSATKFSIQEVVTYFIYLSLKTTGIFCNLVFLSIESRPNNVLFFTKHSFSYSIVPHLKSNDYIFMWLGPWFHSVLLYSLMKTKKSIVRLIWTCRKTIEKNLYFVFNSWRWNHLDYPPKINIWRPDFSIDFQKVLVHIISAKTEYN